MTTKQSIPLCPSLEDIEKIREDVSDRVAEKALEEIGSSIQFYLINNGNNSCDNYFHYYDFGLRQMTIEKIISAVKELGYDCSYCVDRHCSNLSSKRHRFTTSFPSAYKIEDRKVNTSFWNLWGIFG